MTLAAFPGETFRGRVTRIADTVDPQTRTIKVRAEMDNARGRLRPEMFGTIRHTDSVRTVPVVPVGRGGAGGRQDDGLDGARRRALPTGGGEDRGAHRRPDFDPVAGCGPAIAWWSTAACCCGRNRR